MKIYYWPDPQRMLMHVAFVAGEKDEVKTAYNFAEGKAFTIQPGDALPDGAVWDIPTDIFDEMVKGFAEMASEKGIKLESDLKREGKLEATERHLDDMRKLVFKDFPVA